MNQEKKTFYRSLLALVVPMALQHFMTALVSASDALMLGLLNQSSLAAVSLAGQVQFILNIVLAASSAGETVLAAQYWGKKDAQTVESVLAIGLRIAVSASFVLFLGAFLAPQYIMRIYTTDPELIALGSTYLRIVSWSYLFCATSQIYLCIMKNTGRAVKSTLFGSSSVILNIILNAILIFGLFGLPQLGIMGAAIATTCARGLELTLVLIENYRCDILKIKLHKIWKPDRQLFRDYIHYTWPAMANQLIWGLAFNMFAVILGHLGSDAVAANSIAQISRQIMICFCFGLGNGAGILLGNELGKGNLEYAREMGDRLVKLCLVAGAITGLLVLGASPLILRFASSLTDTARGYLRFMLFVCSYYVIAKSFSCTLIGGVFAAGGDTKFGLICDTINMWCVIVPLGFLTAFVFHAPVPVVYFVLTLDEFTKMPAEWIHYKKYRWVKNITR